MNEDADNVLQNSMHIIFGQDNVSGLGADYPQGVEIDQR